MGLPHYPIAYEQHSDLLRATERRRLVEQAMELQRTADKQPTLRARLMTWAARRAGQLHNTPPQCCPQAGL